MQVLDALSERRVNQFDHLIKLVCLFSRDDKLGVRIQPVQFGRRQNPGSGCQQGENQGTKECFHSRSFVVSGFNAADSSPRLLEPSAGSK